MALPEWHIAVKLADQPLAPKSILRLPETELGECPLGGCSISYLKQLITGKLQESVPDPELIGGCLRGLWRSPAALFFSRPRPGAGVLLVVVLGRVASVARGLAVLAGGSAAPRRAQCRLIRAVWSGCAWDRSVAALGKKSECCRCRSLARSLSAVGEVGPSREGAKSGLCDFLPEPPLCNLPCFGVPALRSGNPPRFKAPGPS